MSGNGIEDEVEEKVEETPLETPVADALEAAKKVLQEEAQKRVDGCSKALQEVLVKFNCDIVVLGQFQGNQLQTQLQVTAKPLT